MCTTDNLLRKPNGRYREKIAAKDVRDFKSIFIINVMIISFSSNRDPSIKRTICKGCKGLLVVGVTARVKIHRAGNKSKKRKCKKQLKTQEWTCLQCNSVRNFVLKPDYMIWSEKSQERAQSM